MKIENFQILELQTVVYSEETLEEFHFDDGCLRMQSRYFKSARDVENVRKNQNSKILVQN